MISKRALIPYDIHYKFLDTSFLTTKDGHRNSSPFWHTTVIEDVNVTVQIEFTTEIYDTEIVASDEGKIFYNH